MLNDLRANLRFWYAHNFIKLNKHYEFMMDMSNSDAIAFRILKRYPGVIAEFSNIHMSSEYEMSYDFNVIANPNLCNVESQRFKNFTADIFRNIINSSVEYAKETNENRNTDLVESDAQRTVHEKATKENCSKK